MRVTITCALTAALLTLSGCAATQRPPADPDPASHTMPEGTVMGGNTHVHDDHHQHGPRDTTPGPSAAARMICAGDVVEDVTRIMDAPTEVDPTPSWQAPTLTCRYQLEAGPLTLSVHDATDPATAMAHFQTAQISTHATPIKGLYNLGLPAYQTKTGIVSFIKDNKTLQVDASALDGQRHNNANTKTPTQIAYAIATSVLACWTEHG